MAAASTTRCMQVMQAFLAVKVDSIAAVTVAVSCQIVDTDRLRDHLYIERISGTYNPKGVLVQP